MAYGLFQCLYILCEVLVDAKDVAVRRFLIKKMLALGVGVIKTTIEYIGIVKFIELSIIP